MGCRHCFWCRSRWREVFFGLLTGFTSFTSLAFEAHPGANIFPPEADSSVESLFNGFIRFPKHLFSVHDHGRQRSDRGPQHLSCPWVGLTVHWAVSVRRRTTGRWPSRWRPRSRLLLADDPHPGSDAGRPLDPWVCQHTREPTVLSRVSCRPFHLNFERFHQPCLLLRRTSRKGEDCRPRTTWLPLTLFGQPGSSSFASHWSSLPLRLDGITAGC